MAPTRAAARMQLVEVLDDDLTDSGMPSWTGPPRDDDPDGDLPSVDLRALARRWWPVLVALALVVALVAVVAGQRDRERSDRIAAIPGMARPLGAEPAVLWRAPTPVGTEVLAAGGGIVVVGPDADVWRATSRDARTGAERWSVALGPADRADMQGGRVTCPHSGADVGDVLVCVVTAPTSINADVTAGAAVPRSIEAVALSAADGHVVGTWTAAGDVVASSRVGTDVVLATADSEGFIVVERRDAVTGTVGWTYRSRDQLQDPQLQLVAVVELTPDLVLLGRTSTAVVSIADGHELFYAPPLSYVLAGPAVNGFATWSPTRGGVAYDMRGDVRFTTPNLPVRVRVSDRSLHDPVVLDLGREVIGLDAGSGAQLWSAPTDLDPVLEFDHRMVMTRGDRFGVLDLRTGAVVWSRDLDRPLPWPPISDGALVLAPAVGADGAIELAGYGFGDGVRNWAVPLPEGVKSVEAQGGHVLAHTALEVVALG